MGFLDRFRQSNDDGITVSDVLLKAILSGETLSRQQVESIPQVAADIDLISSTFAMIPFRLYKKTADEEGNIKKVPIDDDPRVTVLNRRTNDTLDPFMMKKALCKDYFLGYNGGGYAYIDKRGNVVISLRYVKSEDVGVLTNEDPIFRTNEIMVNAVRYNDYDFLKLLRDSRDGVSGESIIQEVNKALQTAYHTMEFQLATLKKGGSKKGFLQSKRRIGDEEIRILKESWRNLYSNSSENIPVLNEGVEFKESSTNPTELQLNESIVTLNKEIDAIFHISDDLEKFVRLAIQPIGAAFEASLNKDLLLEKEKEDYFWAADYSELIKATIKERFEAYTEAKNAGWLTINEIRSMENMEAIEGMNVLNIGLSAALYSVDGTLDRDRFYVPNTDTAERKQIEDSGSGKGEDPYE